MIDHRIRIEDRYEYPGSTIYLATTGTAEEYEGMMKEVVTFGVIIRDLLDKLDVTVARGLK